MSKNHDDIDQDTTAAEAADSLKAWLASPAQGDTHAEDSEAASEPERSPRRSLETTRGRTTHPPLPRPPAGRRDALSAAVMPCVRRTSRASSSVRSGARASTDPPPPRSVLASQGNDTRTRDARTAAQQPRARSDEDSNEEDHAPAHAPPRARPYATTVSPGGGITRPALLSVRQAC